MDEANRKNPLETDGRNPLPEHLAARERALYEAAAEQERLTIHQRQREGIDAAKSKGKHLGRPATSLPDNWEEVLALWQSGEITAREAMRRTGMKRTMFYQLAHK